MLLETEEATVMLSHHRRVVGITGVGHGHKGVLDRAGDTHRVGTQLATYLAAIHNTQVDGVITLAAQDRRRSGSTGNRDRVGT